MAVKLDTIRKSVIFIVILNIYLCTMVLVHVYSLYKNTAPKFLGKSIHAEVVTVMFCIIIFLFVANKYWRMAWFFSAFNELLKIILIFKIHEGQYPAAIIVEIVRFVIYILVIGLLLFSYKTVKEDQFTSLLVRKK